VLEGEPGRPERDGYRGAAEQRARHGADTRQAEDQTDPHEQREQELGSDRPIGPNQKRPLQDLLEQLGVDLHPRDVGCDRGGLEIVDDPSGRGPNQHDVIGEKRRIEISG